jgi:hypothetical protein
VPESGGADQAAGARQTPRYVDGRDAAVLTSRHQLQNVLLRMSCNNHHLSVER